MLKKNKKIIFFMPFIGGGGVEKNLFIISNYFSTKFKEILICTHSNEFKYKFEKNIKFITPYYKISQNINLRIKYFLCLYSLLKFLIKNKDSVVFSFQANIYCILLCKILNVRIIVRSNSSPSGWYHNSIKKLIYKRIISLADAVIVNSLDFKKQMVKQFQIKVECIYNPLNKSQIIKKAKKGKKDNFFKSKNKCLKIMNIGRITEQKDQLTILKAVNFLKNKINLKLLIYGRGIEEKNLQDFIKKKKLNNIVKIRNFTDNPYGVLKQSDLFILSSKYEGLPNVLLESIALNKFVISSNCPTGPREILLNGNGGLMFKVGEYRDLSKQINFFIKNKSKTRSMMKNANKNLDRFDYKKNLNKYYKFVLSILDIR
tara:strand:- start:407 stop:1525 length:1119 start_codon:yes stop_codon:yes gene_type:complete